MSDPSDPGVIDRAAYAELEASAGADFALELVDTFLEEAPVMLAELRAALRDGKADTFRRAAHSLKSNSLTFGATELARQARALEQEGLPASGAPLDALDAAYARAAAALTGLRHA